MKVTGTLFLIGTLAISGVPLLSGFLVKMKFWRQLG